MEAEYENDTDKKPLVSIIVPIYNVERYLGRCLDSIEKQTYFDIEIICVEDCSSDDSLQILADYQTHPRIKVIYHDKNQGLGAARDTGIKNSSGQYIVFVDSDDYIAPDYIQNYVEVFAENVDIVIGGYTRIEGNKSVAYPLVDNKEQPWTYVSACGKMFRASFLQQNNLSFRGVRYYEDVPFNYRCMLCRPTIAFIDNPGYFYVLNPASITRSGNQKMKYMTYIGSHRQIASELINENLSEFDREMLEYEFFQALTIGMLVNIRHIRPETAKSLYYERKKTLCGVFPDYLKNKKIGFNKVPSEYKNIRYVLALYALAERLHLDWPFVKLLSY